MANKESNLIKGLIDQHSHTFKTASELVNNRYRGQYDTLADYAREWLTELDEEPKAKAWYLVSDNMDYMGLGADLVRDGYITIIYLTNDENDEKVHIFYGE